MDVHFKARSMDPERHHAASAKKRVWTTLSRFSSAVEHVSITTGDINGPRGGVDAECTVRVTSRAGWMVPVVDTSDCAHNAPGSSLARTKRTVARRLERAASFDRVEPRVVGGSS